MGKAWRRSCSHNGSVQVPPLSVVIEETAPQVITATWSWTGADPDHWLIEQKHDLDPYAPWGNQPGGDRFVDIDQAGFEGLLVTVRVTAKDALNATITPPGAAVSNSIIVSS